MILGGAENSSEKHSWRIFLGRFPAPFGSDTTETVSNTSTCPGFPYEKLWPVNFLKKSDVAVLMSTTALAGVPANAGACVATIAAAVRNWRRRMLSPSMTSPEIQNLWNIFSLSPDRNLWFHHNDINNQFSTEFSTGIQFTGNIRTRNRHTHHSTETQRWSKLHDDA